MDFAHKTPRRLTFDSSDDNPLWTPDGERIVFSSARDGNFGVYWKAADGTGKDERVDGSAFPGTQLFYLHPWSWSGDGKTLVLKGISFQTGKANCDIGVLATEGDRKYRPLLKEEKYNESQPQISPDGRYIAYVSNESG